MVNEREDKRPTVVVVTVKDVAEDARPDLL